MIRAGRVERFTARVYIEYLIEYIIHIRHLCYQTSTDDRNVEIAEVSRRNYGSKK